MFTVMVGGRELYVVTSASDISTIYRDNARLEYDPVDKEAMAQFGWTTDTSRKMLDQSLTTKHSVGRCHDDVKLQLHPGAKLDDLQARLLQLLGQSLQYDQSKLSQEITAFKLTSDGILTERLQSMVLPCGSLILLSRWFPS